MGPSAASGSGRFDRDVRPGGSSGRVDVGVGDRPEPVPTTWLSPSTAMAFVRRIAERLVGVRELGDLAASGVARTAGDAVGAEVVAVHMVGPDGTSLVPALVEGPLADVASPEVPMAAVSLGAPVPTAAVVRRGEPAFWPTRAVRDRQHPELAHLAGGDRSWAMLPMVVRDAAVGVLTFGMAPGRRLGPADAGFLEVVADQCAEAVDRVRTGAALRAERDTLELLSEGTRLMAGAAEPAAVVEELVRLAVPRLAPWCAVYVAEGGVLRRVAVEIHGQPDLARQLRGMPAVALDEPTVLGDVFHTALVRVVPHVDEDLIRHLYAGTQATAMSLVAVGRTALVVPVLAEGGAVGVMSLMSEAWGGSPPAEVAQAAEGLATRAGIALANARRLAEERRTAAELIRALLPAGLPAVPGYQVAARYLPAGSPVAGDWFDLVRLPSSRYMLGVGDAGGHGVPAVSLMAQLRNAARGLAVSGSSPGWVLQALNLLTMGEGEDTFATAVYAVLDPGSGAVVWSSAGHLPPLLYRGGAARYVDRPGHPPLGWPTEGPAPESALHLGEGNALVLVTDGVVESRGGDLTAGLERLRRTVALHGELDADVLTDRIVSTIAPEPFDDCCVLVLRRVAPARNAHWRPEAAGQVCDDRPVSAAPSRSDGADAAAGAGGGGETGGGVGRQAPTGDVGGRVADRTGIPPPLHLEPRPASAGEARRWVTGVVAGWPLTAVETTQLLLSEVVTNTVLHARTPMEVRAVPVGDRLRLEVVDRVPDAPRHKHFEADAETGRGLKLLANLADEWGVHRSAHGKTVWFVVGPGSGSDWAGEVAATQLMVDLDDWAGADRPPPGSPGHPAAQPAVDRPTGPEPVGGPGRTVEVQVLGVPLVVYLEVEQHDDALMREFGLMVESAEGGADHEVPRRLLELASELRSVFQPATTAVRAQVERAIRQGDPTVDLEVTVAAEGWERLLHLAEVLDEADRYCEEGQLLTLASSPVVRHFRHWCVGQIAGQLADRPARRWPDDGR